MLNTSAVLHSLTLSSLIRHQRSTIFFFRLNRLTSREALRLALPLLDLGFVSWAASRSFTASTVAGGRVGAVGISEDLGWFMPNTDPDDGRVDGEVCDSDDCEGEGE